MFYSQFILAKKGPLGTIWIAAHLERKLRKNQVADTDIGVSVDSILFPDVPIALRLSSHLLLGVVRIYSKKVNYLFHDCSETLLKIKQAFRSTAVDLPPEESTAPYHSITLPETFDLDDFELPDNGLFEGNFVDHHISSREQITLQDTLNGMSYSTSQFGPDERFGDGETSHIGLDIDESLFGDTVQTPMDILDNIPLEEHEGDAFHAVPAATFSEMDIDGPLVQDDMQNHPMLAVPNDALPRESIEAEVNDAENNCPLRSPSSEFAQAPSTPGLLQEAIPATYHDGPTSSPVRKLSSSNLVEGVVNDDGEISHLGDDPGPRKDENDLLNLPSESVPCTDQSDARPDSNILESEKDIQSSVEEKTQSFDIPLEEQAYPEGVRQGLDLVGDPLDSTAQDIDSAVQSTNDGDLSERLECRNFSGQPLLPCSSGLKENEVPNTGVHGLAEGVDSDNVLMDKQEDCLNPDLDKLDDTVMGTHLETVDREANSNVQPPESFVSAPPSELDIPDVMAPLREVEIATETEKDDESLVYASGKKRKLMDSTPVLQIGDSAKLSGLPRSERDADFIPDDDDVLASILVGRKTPSLKLKPTPPQMETTNSKRSRLMPKASQYKRKLLLDDAMVMHGDVIRQQLIHTEDIRRVRRKAPCSQLEIWMIENSHLEREMFIEPLFSGASSDLRSLVSQIYEIIDTKLVGSVGTALTVSVEQDFKLVGTSVVSNKVMQEPNVLSLRTEKEGEDCDDLPLLNNQEDQIGRSADSVMLKDSENGHSLDLPGTAIDMQGPVNTESAECVNPEKGNISGLLNENLLVEMPEVVADLDVEKGEGGADMLPSTEEEKTECAAQVNETTNDASVAIGDKIEISVDENAIFVTQKDCNGGALVDSSEVAMPKEAENVTDPYTEPMEVDLPKHLDENVESTNAEETYKESEIATLSQCETDIMLESLDKGEPQIQEVEDKDEMDGQIPINDNPIFDDNHAEFLNLDDEAESEPVEEDENYRDTEQDRFFENSGWSSRTRAVARYLKSLFDNEDGYGRKVVPVDNLLAGKTRKEASRMFFETLVLKTKDYIHVEQDNSFGNINIKPRGKLIKSDF